MRKLKVAVLMALVLSLCSFTLLAKRQDQKPKKKVFVDYQIGFFTEAELRRDALSTTMPIYPEDAIVAGAQGVAHVAGPV